MAVEPLKKKKEGTRSEVIDTTDTGTLIEPTEPTGLLISDRWLI
jgi:hypothetical protein